MVILVNVIFTCIAMYHLMYLGMVFGGDIELAQHDYNYRHTIDKWSQFAFSSHIIACIIAAIAYII